MMQHGQRPNELVVKKLSMLGCVALVLAHSVKDMQDKLRGYHAGMPPSTYQTRWSVPVMLCSHLGRRAECICVQQACLN